MSDLKEKIERLLVTAVGLPPLTTLPKEYTDLILKAVYEDLYQDGAIYNEVEDHLKEWAVEQGIIDNDN